MIEKILLIFEHTNNLGADCQSVVTTVILNVFGAQLARLLLIHFYVTLSPFSTWTFVGKGFRLKSLSK